MNRSQLSSVFGYIIVVMIGAAIAASIFYLSNQNYDAAVRRYQETSKQEIVEEAVEIAASFNQVYQGIRTISLLPSVRNIDRHGENLDENAYESIIQIYNNLRSNIAISEVYIVPVDLEPERIDPKTGELEVPILMFDDAVAAHKTEEEGEEKEKITTLAQAEVESELEILEYRELKKQMDYLKQFYPTNANIEHMKLPFIGTPGILTCDNQEFEKTGNDADRKGIMFSVPFYGNDGKLKGTVTAVLRDNIMRDMLPEQDSALVNSEYGYLVSSKNGGQQSLSLSSVIEKKPDPSLLFSHVENLVTEDPRSQWVLWTGYPDSRFHESGDAQSVTDFRLFGYGFAAVFTLAGIIIIAIIRRTFRLVELKNQELELRIAERTREMESLAQEQEKQKERIEKERRKALFAMADNFEESILSVVTGVVSASEQICSGTENVSQIAADTKTRSAAVADAADNTAQNTGQMSTAADELSASISEISTQTQQSSQIAQDAAKQAAHAKDVIETLSSQSLKVGEIVAVISGIAGQINLLALNATIESARAGEAGKGFAVVANEVKQLANQVNRATEEISSQISSMQSATQTSVDSVLQIISTIDDVASSVETVTGAVESQSAITNEIARNISQTAQGAEQIAHNIAAVQKGAEENGLTAQEVLASARNLSAQSAVLKQKMEEFVQTVRHS